MCFKHCADNFNSRELSTEESKCLDRCVIKFSSVNQRVMSGYVEEQTLINTRRMKEMELQVQAAREVELKAATEAANAAIADGSIASPIADSAPIDVIATAEPTTTSA